MGSLCLCSTGTAWLGLVLGMVLLSLLTYVNAGPSDKRYSVSDICNDMAYYEDPMVNYNNITSVTGCIILCQDYAHCRGFVFDPTAFTCSLFYYKIVVPILTCATNLRYGEQRLPHKCRRAVANVRLCDGNGLGQAANDRGRVEVYKDGEWGTVCDDYWENPLYNNANLVCQTFGFSSGLAVVEQDTSNIPSGYGPVHLDNVACLAGSDNDLLTCPNDILHNCDHDEDVAVICS